MCLNKKTVCVKLKKLECQWFVIMIFDVCNLSDKIGEGLLSQV